MTPTYSLHESAQLVSVSTYTLLQCTYITDFSLGRNVKGLDRIFTVLVFKRHECALSSRSAAAAMSEST